MRHLNSPENKLKIIEQLIILNDDDVFDQIEDLINKSMHRPKPTRLTKQDLIERAQQSTKSIEEKDLFKQDAVEKLTKSW